MGFHASPLPVQVNCLRWPNGVHWHIEFDSKAELRLWRRPLWKQRPHPFSSFLTCYGFNPPEIFSLADPVPSIPVTIDGDGLFRRGMSEPVYSYGGSPSLQSSQLIVVAACQRCEGPILVWSATCLICARNGTRISKTPLLGIPQER